MRAAEVTPLWHIAESSYIDPGTPHMVVAERRA
jgi:hypothetical protein